jgi:SagB-type dehydrogenase family enzyme
MVPPAVRTDPDDDVQPLLAGVVRWEPAGACLDVGDTEVHVAGDGAALAAILGACDGRTTIGELTARHGDDARTLLITLLDQGALVDGAQAWRVLHRQSSAGSALGRPVDDATIVELQAGGYAPAAPLDAGVVLAPAPTTTAALGARRRSLAAGDPPAGATFATLSAVLAAAYGVPARSGGPRSGTVPSAGALYPLIVHVLLRVPLGPAREGLWWHDPRTLLLHHLGPAPADAGALFVPEPSCTALLARDQPIVFVSADLARPSRKYGARAYRYALLEAGAAMQAASLAATELGLPLRVIGGIDDAAVHRLLRLPDAGVALLALLVGG